MNREDKVEEFHVSADHPIDEGWRQGTLELRAKLLEEEYEELMDEVTGALYTLEIGKGVNTKQRENILKEMADLQYVLSGMAVAIGLDLEEAFNRVHVSNMSKVKGPVKRREDGKVMKPEFYMEPILEDLVC